MCTRLTNGEEDHLDLYYTNYMVKIAILLLDISGNMEDNFCVFRLDGRCH